MKKSNFRGLAALVAVTGRHGGRCNRQFRTGIDTALAGVFAKQILLWAIVAWMLLLLTACAGGAKPAASPVGNSGDMMTLDQALKEATIRIDERVAAGSKIAPLNFNSPHDKFSGYVLDEVTANLVDSGKLTVVDRKEVDLIRGEFDFQFSGEVGDDSMQELGRMLGAQSIISGSLTDMGGFYRIVIRVLNVQNASVDVQYRANIAGDNVVAALLTGGKTGGTVTAQGQTSSGGSGSAAPVAQIPAQAAAPAVVYKIGDTGPAGGIVFYDKFSSAGGWRYLEAAPAETEQQFPMGTYANGTGNALGDGKRNTQLIVEELRKARIGGAAQYCGELEYGGYTDWFLPSRDELNLMFQNLKEKGLGGFKNGVYWSSYISGNPYNQDFRDGRQDWNSLSNSYWVRPIRQF